MGQAKLRGSREDRVAQSKKTRQPPKPGLYVSTTAAKSMRFIVEDVSIADEEESEGFFLASMIDEGSAGDMSAAADELDPDQWFALVEQYGLVHQDA
jgi:hypothetical protein